MDYNTQRKKLMLPEYGRNIQKLVDHAKTIEDKDERSRVAMAIINIMGNLNPHLRDMTDFKHKLWDHLAIMANFELDVESPYPLPKKDVLFEKPNPVPYKEKEIKYKHYGIVIEDLIEKAAEFEEGEEKEALIRIIANHMKKSYLKWNKDVVDDAIIFQDLEELSDYRIKVNREIKLTDAKEFQSRPKKQKKQNRRR